MYLTDHEIRERFGEKRPGLELIAVEDAAIPITVLEVQVLAQEEKGLPLLDEFLLRAAAQGIDSAPDAAALLGIDRGLLDNAIAEQHMAGNLSYDPPSGTFQLTARGEVAARDLTSIVPVEQAIPVNFDRTIWRVGDYRENDLIKKRDAVERGMILLPAQNTKSVSSKDIQIRDVQDLVDSGKRSARRVRILEIMRVRPTKYQYLPVKLLVYSDGRENIPEIIVVIDGDDSAMHGNQLESVGGAAKLGLRVAVAAPESRADVPSADEVQASMLPLQPESSVEGDGGTGRHGSARIDSTVVTQIGVFDHRLQRAEALSSATRRILIISPWVKNAVVDTGFMSELERRLRAGVTVHVGHGYGDSDAGSDEQALRRLSNLQARFPEKFTLVRLPNTHAKILVFDDTYVTTSFNWLSFRGDPDRTYRMEEGTLVRSAALASKTYDKYVRVLNGNA